MLTKTVQGHVLTPATILSNKEVRTGMLAAWNSTQKEGIEYGGWIFFNAADQTYRTNQKKGDKMSVALTPAPAYKDQAYVIVADWHCHPGRDVAASRPSKEDIENAKAKDYFMLVMTSKKEPKKGWPEEMLRQIKVEEDTDPNFRIWNIL